MSTAKMEVNSIRELDFDGLDMVGELTYGVYEVVVLL